MNFSRDFTCQTRINLWWKLSGAEKLVALLIEVIIIFLNSSSFCLPFSAEASHGKTPVESRQSADLLWLMRPIHTV